MFAVRIAVLFIENENLSAWRLRLHLYSCKNELHNSIVLLSCARRTSLFCIICVQLKYILIVIEWFEYSHKHKQLCRGYATRGRRNCRSGCARSFGLKLAPSLCSSSVSISIVEIIDAVLLRLFANIRWIYTAYTLLCITKRMFWFSAKKIILFQLIEMHVVINFFFK